MAGQGFTCNKCGRWYSAPRQRCPSCGGGLEPGRFPALERGAAAEHRQPATRPSGSRPLDGWDLASALAFAVVGGIVLVAGLYAGEAVAVVSGLILLALGGTAGWYYRRESPSQNELFVARLPRRALAWLAGLIVISLQCLPG